MSILLTGDYTLLPCKISPGESRDNASVGKEEQSSGRASVLCISEQAELPTRTVTVLLNIDILSLK
jgi:hypothetical protein